MHPMKKVAQMISVQFLKDSAERALATFAQAYVASAVVFGGILDLQALKVAAGAAVLSVFKSLAASKVGDSDSASLV